MMTLAKDAAVRLGTAVAPRVQHEKALPRSLAMLSWALQLIAAAILFQTLFFKFAAAEESVYIFTTLGLEPAGRIGSGIAELVACVLLLIPRTVPFGAVMSLGVISGAIMGHLTKLGIVVKNDGGLLFVLALIVFVCSLAILVIRRRQLAGLIQGAAALVGLDRRQVAASLQQESGHGCD